MRKRHPENERIKRQYLGHLTDAKRKVPKTVDQIAAAIAHFEASTDYKDFKLFHIEQARRYKRLLIEHPSEETGKPLAKATIHARLMALKAFFQWLSGRPGYRKIAYGDSEYFNPSANDTRIATALREKPVPSIEQIRHVVEMMPTLTDIEKRNRALVAFTLLTGARDDAMASLSLRHVDLTAHTVLQDARSVRTKNRKTFTTWFFPVGEPFETIVADWVNRLRAELLFGPDDPIFPPTRIALGESGGFEATGLDRRHWTTAGPIREIFKAAFALAGLPYYNPHSFRNTLALLGQQICLKPEALKAWSQNLGHEKMLTSFTSYGNVASHRQAEIFAEMRIRVRAPETGGVPDPATIQRVLAHVAKQHAR